MSSTTGGSGGIAEIAGCADTTAADASVDGISLIRDATERCAGTLCVAIALARVVKARTGG